MPELPEVEVIRREMELLVKGKTIREVEVIFPGIIGYPETEKFVQLIENKRIEKLFRQGKYLAFHLQDDLRLIVHLRMTGVLACFKKDSLVPSKHLHIWFLLESDDVICYFDQRKFGRMWLLQTGEELTGIDCLGPDWWNDATLELFKEGLASRGKTRIKTLLLDQSFFSGLGNIYVDESLYRSRIHPATIARELSEGKKLELYQSIKELLQKGIEHGGTSIRNYRNVYGETGRFQNRLKVYGRKGERCSCGEHVIQRMVMGGRGTYYCPGCQKLEDIF